MELKQTEDKRKEQGGKLKGKSFGAHPREWQCVNRSLNQLATGVRRNRSRPQMGGLPAMVMLITSVVPAAAIVPPSRPNDAAGQRAGKSNKECYRYFKGSSHRILLLGPIACSQRICRIRKAKKSLRCWPCGRSSRGNGASSISCNYRKRRRVYQVLLRVTHRLSWSRHSTAPKCESPRKV